MSRIVLASGNAGKLRELVALLSGLTVQLIPQSALGIESPEETGNTFEENALLKARYAARHAQLPALADDSGLEVDALDGAPGVRSARFAEDCNFVADAGMTMDARNNLCLLAALGDSPMASWTARYRCVLVAAKDGVVVATGAGTSSANAAS